MHEQAVTLSVDRGNGRAAVSDTTAEPVAATLPTPQAVRRGPLLVALLGATVLGTISNNIVNVPLRQITEDFSTPVTQGVLVASASVLVLAIAMPLTGWVSDRLGRRRTLLLALSVLLAGTVGAAVAPTLGTLARTWPAAQRSRVMGTWGAANGVGQAIGPPIGGLVADAFGWRAIFVGLAPLTVAVLVVTWRAMPRDPAVRTRIDGVGAGSLTVGVALLMSAITAAPQPGVPGWLAVAGVVLGLGSLAVFVLTGLRRRDPFIDPRLLVEMRWLRSATGVFVQQSSLAAVLVAVPLYLTGVVGVSASLTGLLVFALPLVWAVLAPLVGLLADRVGPRPVLRTGLALLIAVDAGLAVALGAGVRHLLPLTALLVAAGVGIALVQTPALTGATRSPAGQRGAGLGLFNMMRFVGAAVGTAAVAAAWPDGLGWLFVGTATAAALGLVLSFLGREMPDT
jgi:MFS family permease